MSPNQLPPAQPIPPRGDLRRRLLAGERTLGAWVTLGSIAAAEVMARAGYDWLVVDLEHGFATEAELLGQLAAIQATPTTAIVRVPSVERLRIDRALDLGADGIMVPQLASADETRAGASWLRYPPDGVRGLALMTRGAGYQVHAHADVAAAVNPAITGVFQVESPAMVAAADELAAIDGVDVLFVGPADLSHGMGIPGQIEHPDFLAALDRVVAAARSHGKAAGILVGSGAAAAEAFARGFTFVGIGSDVNWVISAARSQLDVARSGLAAG